MRLDILLEPPGAEAAGVLQEWLGAEGLQVAGAGQIEVDPAQCFEVLVALRRRCYARELTINVKFTGRED